MIMRMIMRMIALLKNRTAIKAVEECTHCHEVFEDDVLPLYTEVGLVCDKCCKALESRGEINSK